MGNQRKAAATCGPCRPAMRPGAGHAPPPSADASDTRRRHLELGEPQLEQRHSGGERQRQLDEFRAACAQSATQLILSPI